MNMQISTKLKEILIKENIGSEWWKVGSNGRGQCLVALDLKISKGVNLAEKFLQYPDIQVEILTLISEEDYLELGISEIIYYRI